MNLKRYMLIWIFISILVDSLGEKSEVVIKWRQLLGKMRDNY